jgi:hypothetical protein
LKRIKIGFLVNNDNIDNYNYQLLKWLLKNNDKFIVSSFISFKDSKKKIVLKKIPKKIIFKFIILFEYLVLLLLKRHNNHFKKFDLKKIIKKKISIEKKNFNKKEIAEIKNENYDVIIRACTNILSSDILLLPTFGVISFHHGDNKRFRGSPAGFWEVFFRKPSTGFVIQKIDKNIDAGNIIERGFFATKSFFLLNQAELYNKSLFYFKNVLLKLHKNRKLNFFDKSKLGKVYETPKILNQLIYFANTIKILFKKKFSKKKYFKLALFDKMNLKKPIITQNIINKNFLADPFLVKRNGKLFCFAEEFDYKKKKGKIICFKLNENKFDNKKIILRENFHLSFPYIFEFQDKLFMCPDTSEISEIRLYVCVNFPYKWKFYKTIFKNIKAVDTMIFKKKNIWWMLTNVDRSLSGDFNHDLSIYYSNNGPLTNRWHEHSKNPIKNNSEGSRNAGLIIKKNKIIRVSQNHGFDNYGESINFNDIISVHKNHYKEKKVNSDLLNKIRNSLKSKDIHHISCSDNKVIVDFK